MAKATAAVFHPGPPTAQYLTTAHRRHDFGDMLIEAGIESNRKNSALIATLFLEQLQALPHTIVNLRMVRFSVLAKKLVD